MSATNLILTLLLGLAPQYTVPSHTGATASGGGGGSVTVAHHTMMGSVCSNNVTSCAYTGQVVGTTGNAVIAGIQFCIDVACGMSPASCTVSAADGTNTYTLVSAAVPTTLAGSSQWVVDPFLAKNATAGTYTVTFTISGAGCVFYYALASWADFAGANTSTPLDTAVSVGGSGTTASISLSSAGNITHSNEVAYALVTGQNALTLSGTFSLLDNLSTSLSADLVHPASGAGVTVTAGQGTGTYWASLVAISP